MKKYIVLAIFFLVTSAMAASLNENIQSAVDKVKTTAFNVLVTDDMIIDAIDRSMVFTPASSYVNAITRDVAYEKYLRPAFGTREEYRIAINLAFGWSDDNPRNNLINDFRKNLLENARSYLKDPENLWSFYQSKRELILEELNERHLDKLLFNLEKARQGMDIFGDPDFQVIYKAYLLAENNFNQAADNESLAREKYFSAANNLIEGLPEDSEFVNQVFNRTYVSTVNLRTYEEVKTTIDTSLLPSEKGQQYLDYTLAEEPYLLAAKETKDKFKVMYDLNLKLGEHSEDVYASLFAGRRHGEGGKILVETWIRIIDDLIKVHIPMRIEVVHVRPESGVLDKIVTIDGNPIEYYTESEKSDLDMEVEIEWERIVATQAMHGEKMNYRWLHIEETGFNVKGDEAIPFVRIAFYKRAELKPPKLFIIKPNGTFVD